MNKTSLQYSMNDTSELRELILSNPDLPLLVFAGEDAWHDFYPYEMAPVVSISVDELTLYDDWWLDRDDYIDELSNDLASKEEYRDMTDDEFDKIVDEKVENAEFVKAIVIYVG